MNFPRTFIVLSLVALFAFPFGVSAQTDSSRFEHYRKQYAKLHDNYLHSPDDVSNIAALAYFYSEPDNPMRNLPLAMDYVQISETRYRAMIGDRDRYRDVNKLIKKGFTIVGLRQRRQMIIDDARKYVKNGVQPDEAEAFLRAFADDKVIAKEVAQQKSVHSYNKAIELNNEKAYKEYLDDEANTYNRSTIVENLKNLLRQRINASTTERNVDEIVAEYGYPEIKKRADERKCEINYRTAMEANTIEEYMRFLRRYPSSDKYDVVLSALDTLVVREFYTLTTPRQYADFAQKYSELPVSEQARDSLVSLILDHNSGEALHIYLTEFESDEHYNDVYKAYYLRYAGEGNLAPILVFEKNNPAFPLKFLISEDKKTAEEIDKIPFLQPFTDADVPKCADWLKMYMGKGINFVILQRMLQPYTAKNNWKAAVACLEKNEICFENKQNDLYQELKKLLSENVKRNATPVYADRYNLSYPQMTASGQIIVNKHANLSTRAKLIAVRKNQKPEENDVIFDTAYDGAVTVFGLSADEKTMLVGMDGNILSATKAGDVWKVKSLDANGLNTVSHYEGDATFTPDGMGILFVSDRPGGYNINKSGSLFHGDTALATDIYYIPRVGSGWGKPVNLGPAVNTPFSERSPVLSKDLTTMYFTSDRTGGLGFYDIYMTTRTNPMSWTEWSAPVNIGKIANTSFSELTVSLSPDEETLYYTSNAPDLQRYAVYSCKAKHKKGTYYRTATINCHRINNLSELQLSVVDIQGDVELHRYRMTDTVTLYKFDIFAQKEYIIRCSSQGYFVPLMKINGEETSAEPHAFEINACVASGTRIPLTTIEFGGGSASMLPVSGFEIRQIADALKNNPGLKVEVISNVSGSDAKTAYELSLKRSEAIKKALVDQQIDPVRIVASGYGNVNYKKNSSVKSVEIVFFKE